MRLGSQNYPPIGGFEFLGSHLLVKLECIYVSKRLADWLRARQRKPQAEQGVRGTTVLSNLSPPSNPTLCLRSSAGRTKVAKRRTQEQTEATPDSLKSCQKLLCG
ncbi:hypothetical protein KM043_017835 [Ampulex compressa]|nr:hypothetical protein KM043_017835 [Ampulex compressa]